MSVSGSMAEKNLVEVSEVVLHRRRNKEERFSKVCLEATGGDSPVRTDILYKDYDVER